jgi:radical SAM superfamily enzyme YgiQ (UPF0313 family)
VAQEIETLFKTRKVREFAFFDDALLLEKESHLVPILEEILKRKMPVHFHTPNGIHPKMIDVRLAKLMADTGFRTIRLSYETRNLKRQKAMGFKVKDEHLINAVSSLVDAGFSRNSIGSYVLMGLPDQGAEEVMESMMFVYGLGLTVSLAAFSPIPGTRSWQEAVKKGCLMSDGDPLLTNNSIFPMKTELMDYQVFMALGTLSSIGNKIVRQGRNPSNEPEFKRAVKNLKKRMDLESSIRN